ncbi:GTP cyclohydrolase I [Nonomuraea sp. NPDC005650]|uniref:GTP cyclohydrolase I n=1 Tax=Nonomuraea sp. NPDC005650 TaxID=3157045 RepID=UPI0033A8C616
MTAPAPAVRAAARAATRALIEPARQVLEGIGIPASPDTARRYLNTLMELTAGARTDPDRHLANPAPITDELAAGLVTVAGISIAGLCDQHAMPYAGTALVAYVPAAARVPTAKLARLAQEYAARPTSQDEITREIVGAIMRHLRPVGAAAILTATHTCMTLRGACATGATVTTSHVRGDLATDPTLHAELIATWSRS